MNEQSWKMEGIGRRKTIITPVARYRTTYLERVDGRAPRKERRDKQQKGQRRLHGLNHELLPLEIRSFYLDYYRSNKSLKSFVWPKKVEN